MAFQNATTKALRLKLSIHGVHFFPINSVIAGCNKIPCDFRSIQYGFPPDFFAGDFVYQQRHKSTEAMELLEFNCF